MKHLLLLIFVAVLACVALQPNYVDELAAIPDLSYQVITESNPNMEPRQIIEYYNAHRDSIDQEAVLLRNYLMNSDN